MKHITILLLFCLGPIVMAQELKISGTVTDGERESPIANATIKLLNSQKGSITTSGGVYEIEDLSPGTYELTVSYIGYATQRKKVVLDKESISLDFVLIKQTLSLDEVIVTSALKREVAIQEVGASITKVGDEAIEKRRLWNQRNIASISPNLVVANFADGDALNYSIRGIFSADFNPSVATYLDGINQFDIYSNIEFLHDVESIEILKGPQGTLFGRNALGGAINITTKKPTNIWTGRAGVSIGNFALQRYNLSLSGPLVKDRLFLKLSGVLGQRDGYFTNTVDNSNFNSQEYNNFNGSLKFNFSSRWSVTLDGKIYQRDVVGYAPPVLDVTLLETNPFEIAQDAVGSVEQKIEQGALKVEHNGKGINITNVLAFKNSRYVANNVDVDFTPADLFTFTRPIPGAENTFSVITNELNISSPASADKLKWVAGTYFFRQKAPINQIVGTGADAALFDPTAPNQVLNFNDGTNTGIAIYGHATYPLSNTLELTAGIRYDYEDREAIRRTDFIQGDNPQINISPERTLEASFDAFSPKIGLQWSASPNINVFLTYSRGFRIGGVNASLDPRFESFEPETSDNFEIGVKGKTTSGKFNYAASAFLINRDDIQAQVFEPVTSGISFVTLNAGDGRNFGLEAEFGYLLSKGLQISYGLGLLDAKYTSLDIQGDFNTGQYQSLEDKTAIFAPPITSNLSIDYTKQFVVASKSVELQGSAQLITLGRTYFDFLNTYFQGSYSTLNFRIGGAYENVGIHFWAQNALDEQFVQWSPAVGAPTPVLGAPATYGLSLSYKF